MKELIEEIQELINLKTEGDFWDFKQKWHSNKSDLLLDIICMANNLADHDAYLIIGVDDNANICGVPNEDRMNQQAVIDFLKNIKFAHGSRPIVYIKTINLDKEIDIIIIKNTKNVPYYLIEDYQGVYRYQIYTRIADTNTSKNSSADFDKVEYLWKKRLGLDLSPLDKAIYLLKDTKLWYPIGTDGEHSSIAFSGEYYHKQFPEFTINYKECTNRFANGKIDRIEHDFYWMNELPSKLHNSYLYTINVKYFSTVLYSSLAVFADSYRFKRIMWKKETLFKNTSGEYISYCYIDKDSLEFMLDNWLCNSHDTIKQIEDTPVTDPFCTNQPEYSISNPYNVILCFENKDERMMFHQYVITHKEEFLNELGDCSYSDNLFQNPYSKCCDSNYIEYLCESGKLLNQWLIKWKKEKTS